MACFWEPGTGDKKVPYELGDKINLVSRYPLAAENDFTEIAWRFVRPREAVSWVSEVIDAIKGASTKKKRPVKATLMGHGTADLVRVGTYGATEPNKTIGQNGVSQTDLQKFGAALRGKLSTLLILSCNVAIGIDLPGHWMNQLSRLLSGRLPCMRPTANDVDVEGYDNCVFARDDGGGSGHSRFFLGAT